MVKSDGLSLPPDTLVVTFSSGMLGLLLFCPPGMDGFNPGKVLIISWFVEPVLFCPLPPCGL